MNRTIEEIKGTIIDIYNVKDGFYWLGDFEYTFPIRSSWPVGTTVVFEYKMRYSAYDIKKVRIEVQTALGTIDFEMEGFPDMRFTMDDESLNVMYGILLRQKEILSVLDYKIA